MHSEIKTIAFYLPQFHQTPENDDWWGEGYTEWTAVKNAKPLFVGHYQPHIPLNSNYYCLLDKQTMEWQAKLMHQYGIDGMCFYHYYFEGGRKILEKPAENLLKWKDIDMPFCFCWANESWVRSWSNIKGNIWDSLREDLQPESDGVLLRQNYGTKASWRKHFEYLQVFFSDERYIRIDSRPILIIYKAEDIHCINDMLREWDRMAIENGEKKPYYISIDSRMDCFDGKIIKNDGLYSSYLNRPTYADICREQITMSKNVDYDTFICCQLPFDNTPRNGANGKVFTAPDPSQFFLLLQKAFLNCKKNGSSLLFINAWNEWAEGMHLEPDERFGFEWLRAISEAKKNCNDVSDDDYLFSVTESEKSGVELCGNASDYIIRKYVALYSVFEQWLSLKEKGKKIGRYLTDNGYKRVAIYGIGIIGTHLLEQLFQEGVDIICCFDKNKTKAERRIPVYQNFKDFPEVDVIIICIADSKSVYMELSSKVSCNIVTVNDLIEYSLAVE